MKTIPELQAAHLTAHETHEAARVATHEARRKVAELLAKEQAAADALANAEKALAHAVETQTEE